MTRTAARLLLPILALALCAAPALGADMTRAEGETVSLTVGDLPSGFVTYWVSDIDGYIAQGETLETASLSVGVHTLYALIYRVADQQHVWTGSLTVEVVPRQSATGPTTPPAGTATGGDVAPGEFEEVSLLLLGCPDAYSVSDLYPEMLDALRGVVRTRIYVDNDYVRYDLIDLFQRTGVDDADYAFVRAPIDSIWMRDYGPLFVKSGGGLEVVDLRYYPNRPNDDAVPLRFAQSEGLPVRDLPLAWEGGNYTSDGQGGIYATTVLLEHNRSSRGQLSQAVASAFGGDLMLLEPMLDDGGTGHLDMFCLLTGPRSALLNRFPSWHQNYSRMERHAGTLSSLGFALTRTDPADTGFKSYTNGVLINGTALVPTYARPSADAAALAAYRQAGYRAVGIDCRRIIEWSGALHCITITVPR